LGARYRVSMILGLTTVDENGRRIGVGSEVQDGQPRSSRIGA